jgi:pimeloyl-ACP methyl ester carboxylesterase
MPAHEQESVLTQFHDLTALEVKPQGQTRTHPLVFIHGWWGGAWVWDRYLSFFGARGYHCYALNLRGNHGSRPVSDLGKVSFDDHLSDVREVIEMLDKPIVIGHSVGGLLVLKLAEQVELPAFVAIVPAAPRGIVSLTTLRVFLPYIWTMLRHRPFLLKRKAMFAADLNRLPPPEQASVYEQMVLAPGKQGVEIGMLGIPVDAKRIAGPILIISGTDDKLVPAAVARTVARRYRADFREYAGHGHYIMREPGWEKVAADIARWLAEKRRQLK